VSTESGAPRARPSWARALARRLWRSPWHPNERGTVDPDGPEHRRVRSICILPAATKAAPPSEPPT